MLAALQSKLQFVALIVHLLFSNLVTSLSNVAYNSEASLQISGSRDGFSLEIVTKPSSTTSTKIRKRDEPPAGYHFAIDVKKDWYIEINVGTPWQTLLVNIDTGAPDFYLHSILIDPAIRHNAVLYDPYVSSTAGQVVGYSFAQSYGSGALSMSGPVVQDNVKVGNLVIAKFMFECVNKTSKELGVAGEPSHGGWGMNLDPNGMNTRPNRISSWFPAIMNYLNSQVFCIDWNRATDTGTIDFGYVDPAKYTGAMAYTPVEPGSQLWIFPISGIAIGTTFFRGEFRVMMDTGDPGWGFKIPRWAVDEYFKALFPGKGLDSLVWNEQHSTYQIPCATQLIDIVWGVGLEEKRGIGWKDLKKYYIQGVSTEWCLCDVSSEHGMDNGKEIYHWPQWVQKRNYMVYDYGNRRVGFGGKDY